MGATFNTSVDEVEPLDVTGLQSAAPRAPAYGRESDITDVLAGTAGAGLGYFMGADKPLTHKDLKEMRLQMAADREAKELRMAAEAANAAAQKSKFASGVENWVPTQYNEEVSRSVLNQGPSSQPNAAELARQAEANIAKSKTIAPHQVPAEPGSLIHVPLNVGSGSKVLPTPAPAPVQMPLPPAKAKPINFGSSTGHALNTIGGAAMGVQANDALQRAQQGDYLGSGLGALSSAGAGAATFSKNPKVKAIGAGVSAGTGALQRLYDYLRNRNTEEPKYAGGGAVKKLVGAAEGPLSRVAEYAHKIFDPRFDTRILEQEKLAALRPRVEQTGPQNVPTVSLADFEGRPFITSMSDRTAAGGNLVGVNGMNFNRPVPLKGGQDYMFNNPGNVWASDKNPVGQIMRTASALRDFTGQDPLYLPWRMAPTGGDFAHMTGQAMLAQAEVGLNKTQKRLLDKQMKTLIPDWQGIDSPVSLDQFANAPTRARKAAQNLLDKNFRDVGGLGLGEARLAVADPKQVAAPEGGLMNVGRVFANKAPAPTSGHESYAYGVPGEGLGRLDRELQVYQMLPEAAAQRGMADVTRPGGFDIRALQMKPYAGIIDDKLLKALGY